MYDQLNENDRLISPMVCVFILDFILFQENAQTHTCLSPIESKSNDNGFYYHFIELPKFDTAGDDAVSTRLKKWAYFFKNEGHVGGDELRVRVDNDPFILRAHNAFSTFTADKDFLSIYQAR